MSEISNTSGIHPKGHRLLVLPIEVEVKSEGGIILHTEMTAKKEELAQIQGRVVEVGETCWHDQAGEPWAQPGDLIVFGKYTGIFYDGKDGQKYRVINDLDVVASLDE